ncbi:helix-turn-helix transcriptional regulator [Paenibacillus harenae]|uniref:helix-turn-helix transcriptional regulator n=1 Tax=Paenibacillus harenae TaxID=306543 RepID=UPI001FE12F9D|nr:WYL domain-containing protein [Paenibacillus harenae]
MHRIGWFDQQVRAGNYPNSSLLAKEFEISRRQAARDIEYMEMSLRAPLKYVAKQRGYCYEDEAFILPHMYMTDEEKKVLGYLALRYRHYNYDHSGSVGRVADLLGRFESTKETASGDRLRLPIFDVHPRTIQHMELLSSAMSEGRSVMILYKDEEGERSLHVTPIRFASRYHADYVLVHGEGDERPTSLRLDGICQISISGPAFKHGPVAETTDFEGRKPARTPYLAQVKLPAALNGDSWNGYRIHALEQLVYTVSFYDADSFLQHLLVAEWEELISPRWLKQKLQSRCEQALSRLNLIE